VFRSLTLVKIVTQLGYVGSFLAIFYCVLAILNFRKLHRYKIFCNYVQFVGSMMMMREK